MEFVYTIGGLVAFIVIQMIIKKIFLDSRFKKFDLGNGDYYFKASLSELVFLYVIPYFICVILASICLPSVPNEVIPTWGKILFFIGLAPSILYVYVWRPIRTIRKNWHMKIENGKFHYFNGTDNVIELSQLKSIQEKRQSASRGSSTYIFNVEGEKIKIDFYDYGLDGGYAERISAIIQKEINR